ncbi:MAG: T9SS type A sorting domain-containing protein [Melioribacteraceae bacterium]|nr:T9SS type A sorting domain-containing protein [Melioribacteraceae bacterium]
MRLLWIFFFCAALNLTGQQYENFSTANSSIAGNNISSIQIDDSGIIWVSTDKGVSVYDGNTWVNYNSSDVLKSDNINDLYLSDDESLWAASDSGVSKYSVSGPTVENETDYFSVEEDSIVSNNIFSVVSDYLLSVWFGTDNGISVSSVKGIDILNKENGAKLRTDKINKLAVQNDGWVYAATNGGGISRFKYDMVDGISSASIVEKGWSGLPSDTVLTVYITEDKNHFYGTTKGAGSHYEEDSKNAKWERYTVDQGLINNRVHAITTDENGNIWFGTEGGVSRFDGENYISFTETEGLISNNVSDLKVAPDGAVWIATDNGITKLTDITDVDESKTTLPESFEITLDAYPNPFNPKVNVSVGVNKRTSLKLFIYDIQGRLIKKLVDNVYSKGNNIIAWNSINDNGMKVNSGIYIIKAVTASTTITKKIILLK